MNPYQPPSEADPDAGSQLPLQPITASQLFAYWMLIAVIPTLTCRETW